MRADAWFVASMIGSAVIGALMLLDALWPMFEAFVGMVGDIL